MHGDGGSEILYKIGQICQDQGEDHHCDLNLLEAADTPHLLQEVAEGHGQDLAEAAGLRYPGPSICFLSLHAEGGGGLHFVSSAHQFLGLL